MESNSVRAARRCPASLSPSYRVDFHRRDFCDYSHCRQVIRSPPWRFVFATSLRVFCFCFGFLLRKLLGCGSIYSCNANSVRAAATQESRCGDRFSTTRAAPMLCQPSSPLLLQTTPSAPVPPLCASSSRGGREGVRINPRCCCTKRIGCCGCFTGKWEFLITIMLSRYYSKSLRVAVFVLF